MKKVLLLLSVISITLSSKAQFVNGDFEGTFSNPIPIYTNITDAPGWGSWFYSIETNGAFGGKQSLKLETFKDPDLMALVNAEPYKVGLKSDVITGMISQIVKGPVSNPDKLSLNFVYKNNTIKDDSSVILVQIRDTLTKGTSDDIILYYERITFTGIQNTWTQKSFPLVKNGGVNPLSYAANAIFLYLSPSIKPLYGRGDGYAGSKLWLDNISLTDPTASLDEQTLNLKVYPNPATDVLNIKMDEEIQSVLITSIDGKVVNRSNEATVNTSGLNAGVYVYEVTSVTGKVSKGNFIKE
jgi:hypothetical protein